MALFEFVKASQGTHEGDFLFVMSLNLVHSLIGGDLYRPTGLTNCFSVKKCSPSALAYGALLIYGV